MPIKITRKDGSVGYSGTVGPTKAKATINAFTPAVDTSPKTLSDKLGFVGKSTLQGGGAQTASYTLHKMGIDAADAAAQKNNPYLNTYYALQTTPQDVAKYKAQGVTSVNDMFQKKHLETAGYDSVEDMQKDIYQGYAEKAKPFDDKLAEIQNEAQGYSKGWQTAGQIGQTIGAMVPAIAASAVTKNPLIGIGAMSYSGGGMTAKEAYDATGDFKKASNAGNLSMIKEAATEALVGGIPKFGAGLIDTAAKKLIGKAPAASLASQAKTYLTSKPKIARVLTEIGAASGESFEEVVAGFLDPYVARATYDPNAENATMSDLMQQGLIGGLAAAVLRMPVMVSNNVIDRQNKIYETRKYADYLNDLNDSLPEEHRAERFQWSTKTTAKDLADFVTRIQEADKANVAAAAEKAKYRPIRDSEISKEEDDLDIVADEFDSAIESIRNFYVPKAVAGMDQAMATPQLPGPSANTLRLTEGQNWIPSNQANADLARSLNTSYLGGPTPNTPRLTEGQNWIPSQLRLNAPSMYVDPQGNATYPLPQEQKPMDMQKAPVVDRSVRVEGTTPVAGVPGLTDDSVEPAFDPAAMSAAQQILSLGAKEDFKDFTARAVAQVNTDIENVTNEAANYYYSYEPQGVELIPNTQTLGTTEDYKMIRASKNENWYRDFYAQYGKKPNKTQARELAENTVSEELRTGGGEFVSPELANRYQAVMGISAIAEQADRGLVGIVDNGDGSYNFQYGRVEKTPKPDYAGAAGSLTFPFIARPNETTGPASAKAFSRRSFNDRTTGQTTEAPEAPRVTKADKVKEAIAQIAKIPDAKKQEILENLGIDLNDMSARLQAALENTGMTPMQRLEKRIADGTASGYYDQSIIDRYNAQKAAETEGNTVKVGKERLTFEQFKKKVLAEAKKKKAETPTDEFIRDMFIQLQLKERQPAKSKTAEEFVKNVKGFLSQFGVNVETSYTLDMGENAFYDPSTKTIVLNARLINRYSTALHFTAHELVHYAISKDPQLFNDLKIAMGKLGKMEITPEHRQQYIDGLVRYQMEKNGGDETTIRAEAEKIVTEDYMLEEVMAERFAEIMDDYNLLSTLNKAKPGLLDRIKAAIKEMLTYSKGERLYLQQKQDVINMIDAVLQGKEYKKPSGGERFSFGYHAGDLGKAEHLGRQYGSDRGTGHFGTGTYFVGDRAQINDFGFEKRPHHKVEFDNYKLFRPLLEEYAWDLHDGLKYINDHFDDFERGQFETGEITSQRRKATDAIFEINKAIQDLYAKERNPNSEVNTEEAQKRFDDNKAVLDEMMNSGNFISDAALYDVQRQMENYHSAAKGLDREAWYYDILGTYINKEYADDRFKERRALNKTIDRLAWILKIDENKVLRTLKEVRDYFDGQGEGWLESKDADKTDSASTLFMKVLGYEGVDVRGFKGLDNTKYGSVIYDLRPEDKIDSQISEPKFSLNKTVEETKNLVAVHNLTEEQLEKSLDLGGFPMPSIAIVKADAGHDKFGPVSVVFGKNTIDPKANKNNKVYAGDAWTPTVPSEEIDVDVKKLSNVFSQFKKTVDSNDTLKTVLRVVDRGRMLYNPESYIEARMPITDGLDDYVRSLSYQTPIRLAYLADKEIDIKPVVKENPYRFETKIEPEGFEYFLENYPGNVESLIFRSRVGDLYDSKRALPIIADVYRKFDKWVNSSKPENREALVSSVLSSDMVISDFLKDLHGYQSLGGGSYIDVDRTTQAINNRFNHGSEFSTDYYAWLKEKIAPTVVDRGIRNNKDYLTPAGNRRSFKQLHDPATLENIVKAMKTNAREVGEDAFGAKPTLVAAAETFDSIADIKKNSKRLSRVDSGEYFEMVDAYDDELDQLTKSLVKHSERDSWKSGAEDAQYAILEIAQSKTQSIKTARRILDEYGFRDKNGGVSDATINDIFAFLKNVKNISTEYFEAKPRRAVKLDEIKAVIVPTTTTDELKSRIKDLGIDLLEYKEFDDAERLEKLNSIPDVRFSLNDSTGAKISTGMAEYMDDSQARDDQGRLVRVYHGTMSDFWEFDNKFSNPESDMGSGFYFTNNRDDVQANYANAEGGDLTSKIERRADELMGYDGEEMSYEEALEEARREFTNRDEPRLIEAYLKITNPVILDGKGGTYFGFTENYDEENDIYEEPEGELVDFVQSLRNILNFHEDGQRYMDSVSELFTSFMDYGGGSAYDVIKEAKDILADLADFETNSMGGNEVIRQALEDMGYDGIIDKMVAWKFGSKSGRKIGMVGVNPDTTHYIVFNSNQAKEVTNENPTDNPDIRFSFNDANAPTIEDILDMWEEAKDRYGTKKSGLTPEAVADDGTRLTDFWDNLFTSEKATPDSMKPVAQLAAISGIGSYITLKDAKAEAYAKHVLASRGTKAAYDDWMALMRSGKIIDKNDIVLGEMLLIDAAEREDVSAWEKLVAELAPAATRAGQTLQAFSMLRKLSPSGRRYAIDRFVENLKLELADRGKQVDFNIPQDLLTQLDNARTIDEMNAIEEQIIKIVAEQVPPSLTSRVVAFRYLAMLFNFRTHLRNIVSNFAMYIARNIKDTTGAALESVLVKDGQRTKTLRSASPEVKAFVDNDWKVIGPTLFFEGKSGYGEMFAKYQKSFGNSLAGKFLNKLNDMNSGALYAEDLIFAKLAYKSAMSHYLTANNISAQTLMTGTKEANTLLAKAREYATEEARKATYREASVVAKLLNDAEQKTGVIGKLVVGGMMPFKKTPANILKRGVEYSPLGLMDALSRQFYYLKKGDINAAQFVDHLAAGLTGSAAFGLGYFLAGLGLMKAGGDDDKNEYYEQMMGYQPYSITIAGRNYTVDWLTPISMPLMAGVELVNSGLGLFGDDTEEFNMNRVIDAAFKTMDPLTNLSMLSGLNQAIGNFSDNKLGAAVQSAAQSYAGQFIPTAFGQVARTIDPVRRSTYAPEDTTTLGGKGVETFLNKMQNKVPGISSKNEPYVDLWGREEVRPDNFALRAFENMAAPWYSKEVQKTAVDDELSRVFAQTGSTSVLPGKPDSYFTQDGKKYILKPNEYTNLQKRVGQTANDTLSTVFATPDYKALDDKTKELIISDVFKYSKAVGKAEYVETSGKPLKVDAIVASVEAAEDAGIDPGRYFISVHVMSDIKGDKDPRTGESVTRDKRGRGLVTRKTKINEYLDTLDLTKEQRNAMLEAAGYDVKGRD